MALLSSIAKSPTHRVLVFGAPKAGKTQLVGTLASKYNLLWFDLENGIGTLLKLPVDQQQRVNVISLADTKEYPIAIETMLKVITGNAVEICDNHGKVSCPLCKKDSAPVTRVCLNELPQDTVLVVDSLTQLTNSAIAHIIKGKPEDYKMDFTDWGNLKAVVEKFLSCVQQAKYNVVCISHEEEVAMEDGRNKLVPVCGSSKSSRNTAKYFDHVLYCEVKNKKHVVGSSTGYSNNILTGSRTDAIFDDNNGLLELFASGTTSTTGAGADQGTKAISALSALRKGI